MNNFLEILIKQKYMLSNTLWASLKLGNMHFGFEVFISRGRISMKEARHFHWHLMSELTSPQKQ